MLYYEYIKSWTNRPQRYQPHIYIYIHVNYSGPSEPHQEEQACAFVFAERHPGAELSAVGHPMEFLRRTLCRRAGSERGLLCHPNTPRMENPMEKNMEKNMENELETAVSHSLNSLEVFMGHDIREYYRGY